VKPDTATMFMELKGGNLDRMNLNAIQYTRQTEYPKFKRMYNNYRYMPFYYIYLV
jgi:peptide/nickel transport system substrate-binding protein